MGFCFKSAMAIPKTIHPMTCLLQASMESADEYYQFPV
jgi:hypothetical protein